MDIKGLLSIYGRPDIVTCTECDGQGCLSCRWFGYYGYSLEKETKFVFDYPMYVKAKQRKKYSLIKNVTSLILLFFFIVSLIISFKVFIQG